MQYLPSDSRPNTLRTAPLINVSSNPPGLCKSEMGLKRFAGGFVTYEFLYSAGCLCSDSFFKGLPR